MNPFQDAISSSLLSYSTAIYRPISNNTGSTETWSAITEWLRICREEHSHCPSFGPTETGWYPTRLLDIGPKSAPFQDPRLIFTTQNKMEGAYATLSHCWGKNPLVTLKTERLKEFVTNGIPHEELPKTFREALVVTRNLGVRYLWIDSLCILQSGAGSVEDWQKESAMMHRVYENSYCNIAATAAEDSRGGLFHDRDPRDLLISTMEVDWENEIDPLKPYKGGFTINDLEFWSENVEQTPLLKRAWVYQERLLTGRILHFGSQQLLWECRTSSMSESYPNPSRAMLTGYNLLTPKREFVEEKWSKAQSWARIIDTYTRCLLTKEEDKLIALSGIAQQHQSVRDADDKYLAGIWLKDFPTTLCWSADRQLLNSPFNHVYTWRPTTYRAPSWSWASVEGHIQMGVSSNHSLITVLDTGVMPVTSNATGQLKDAYLTVRGKLKILSILEWHGTYSLLNVNIYGSDAPQCQLIWTPDEYSTPYTLAPLNVLCLAITQDLSQVEIFETQGIPVQGITLVEVEDDNDGNDENDGHDDDCEDGPSRFRRTGHFSGWCKKDFLDGEEEDIMII